jgi:type IV secretory pathway VirD2 relaxase
MHEFATVAGFEEAWRPPVRSNRRTPETVLAPEAGAATYARLSRLAARAPEVMVKVTGRTRTSGHLRAHLNYITRHGGLEAVDQDGNVLLGRRDVGDLAEDWSDFALADRRRRLNSPFSHSVVLSMPAGTYAEVVRDAAGAFAETVFGGWFDYVYVLHTDTARPHVHLSVCSRGDMGTRLNPKKADLETWRQVFAQALRDRGVEAEATPRRARGVTRKAERGPLRQIRERHAAGLGPVARTVRAAYREAAAAAFQGASAPTLWEQRLIARQASVRRLYLAQAALLNRSPEAMDRVLGARVEGWVRSMPAPASRRLELARELRSASRALKAREPPSEPLPRGPERRR